MALCLIATNPQPDAVTTWFYYSTVHYNNILHTNLECKLKNGLKCELTANNPYVALTDKLSVSVVSILENNDHVIMVVKLFSP